MMLPFVAGLLLAYGGMVGLCQGMERNFKLVWKREPSPVLRHALRMTGAALLVGSFASCVWAWGWAMGPVGWLGAISLATLVLAWLLPYHARLAVVFPVAGIPLWLLAWTVMC